MHSIKSHGELTRGRGITETVRLQWIYSMDRCAAVHDAMTIAKHIKQVSSEQHIDLSTSRCNRDFSDLGKIQYLLDVHEPFDSEEWRLRFFSSGLTASEDDGVDCVCTEEVGAKIQQKNYNVTATEASLKRSDQIRSLNNLQPGIQINNKKYHIDPDLFFKANSHCSKRRRCNSVFQV